MAKLKKKRFNKIDIYVLVLSVFTFAFVIWCAWEFHYGRDEPTALIGLVGAYIVTELFSLARIKMTKENNSSPPSGPVG